MNTISNDQGNHVNAQNIARFVATGEKIPGNQAFKFVWRDFPLQQSSRLDKRKHVVSRAGREAGEYPSGYKVRGCYEHVQLMAMKSKNIIKTSKLTFKTYPFHLMPTIFNL